MSAAKDKASVFEQIEHGDGVIIHWTVVHPTGQVMCATIQKPPKFVIKKNPHHVRKNHFAR